MPADSASNMHVSSDIFSSIGMRGGVTASNQDSNSGCSTPEPHRIDSDPTSSSTNSRSMSGSGETEVTHTTNSTRDARVGGQERSKQDPGLLVLVLNALAKLAIARAAEAGPRGGAAVEWKQLLESVFYLLAELEPCLIETQQQSQQQQQQQQQPFRNEAISAVSREGSTSSSMTAPHLARLVRSLNMLLLLHPPPTATPTSTAHSKDPQPLGHHSQTSPPQQQPQQQHQKQRRQQQHRSLPFSLPSHWVAHLRAALTAVLQHVQPEELVLLLRALSLDGACVALSLKGAPTSSVGLEEEVTSGGSTERRTSSPSPNASRDSSTPPPMPSPPSSSPTVLSPPLPHSSSPPPPLLSLPAPLLATPPSSSSSPPAVAATAMAAVLRVLPLLSPRQCSICLSCVTLLEWQPARPWVLAVMSRLEQAELQAIKLQGDQGSTPLQQRGQLQHQQHQGQPSLSGKQQRQPSESLSAVHFSPMSVRDAEQVLVSLAHLHVHPPPRLADMLLRALAAAFVPTPLPSSADGPQSPATSPPGLQSPQPPQAPPSPYMPEATAAAAAALKAQGHPTSPPATALQHPLPPPAPPPPFSSTTRTPRNAASQSHSLPSFPFRPPQLSLQQAGTASDHNQEGTTADPPANPQLPSAPLSPSLTPTQLSSSLWAIASLGLHPPAPWLAAFMQITFNTIQGFSARTLAEVLWAIASLRWEPSQLWMDRALAAMSSKVEELRAGEVAITVWALSRLRFRARSDLLAALFAHVTSPRLLPLLDGRGISMLMTACARTNYMPPATSMRPLASRILSLLQNTASASRTPPQQRHASPEAPEADSGQQQHQQHQQQRKHTRSARRQTHHTRQQHGHGMHEPQGSSLSLAPQGIANLAWAIEVRALYTEYPELVPALHAASLAVMPSFSPVELGMLGVAIGSIVQAQLHARNQAKAKAEAGGGRSSASGGRGRRRPQQAGSFPPVILPSSEWVAAYAAASRHVLLQQHRAQQLSAAQLAGRDKGRTSTSNNRRDANSAIGIGRGSTGSSTSAGGGLNGGGGSSARVASSMLMGFARMSPDGKLPPSDWLDTWFEVTAGTLLTFNPREMEQVCEGLRLLRPPPAPPLPWVRAFSDRRDVLSDHAGTNAHLRKQLLLVLRMLRNAWQDKVSQASAQSP
uniref:Uncharacterized protein n=1 Tax=Dunaliella tertiolecta TaxID=3047 RepID=A0A7S3QTH2_DUNTE